MSVDPPRPLAIRGRGRRSRRPFGSPHELKRTAFLAAFAFLVVLAVDPYSGVYSSAAAAPSAWGSGDGQSLTSTGELAVDRDEYDVSEATAPVAGVPAPGTAKAIARELVAARGWSETQYNCLVALWTKESHWNVYATNASSGAYGIPQALPGSKMATAGADWATNPRTQIIWGLGYISARYGNPCTAWAHSQSRGWY